MDTPFVVSQVSKVFALLGVAFISGLLVVRGGVRVNYTRKVNHFALYCLPPWIDLVFGVPYGVGTSVINGCVTGGLFAMFLQPVRERVSVAQTMFASYDRPEDRPHTMRWLAGQYVAALLVIVPMLIYFEKWNITPLALMVMMVTVVGDGLAEPVGIRYGKRKYKVPGFRVDRVYERSYAGSACVFIVALLGVLLFYDTFTSMQLAAAIVLFPMLVTLAEALSPHTWDTPFILLAGAGSVVMVTQLIE